MSKHAKMPIVPLTDIEITRRVSSRLRLARHAAGISQEQMAKLLGITFQQVQKYEKGTNRIASARLARWAAATDKPVEWFFADIGAPVPAATGADVIDTIAHDRQLSDLARIWLGLPRPARELLAEQARMLVEIVTATADGRRAA